MDLEKELRELDCGDITCLDDFVAGSGGLGDVLFGYHKGLKQQVAIKVFEVAGGAQEKSLIAEIIKEEMEHLLKADHKNVVRIFGYVQWSSAMGIVIEYCKDGDLETLLKDTSKELGLALRVCILFELASAMNFFPSLPDRRLIHKNLKPGNIFLTEELSCKLADFTSSTYSILANVDSSAENKKQKPNFTPYYTATEKLKELTIKARKEHDVYVFGILLYWFLARKAPYPRLAEEERRELLEEFKKGKRPDCQEIQDWIQTLFGEDREIAEQLQLLMKQCWDQDPTKRPTMTEIREELTTQLDKQQTTKLLSQISLTLNQMDLDKYPGVSESQRVPLHYFSTQSGSFHVPSRPGSTKRRSSETADGAQADPSPQQGKISTSNNQQQPGSHEGLSNKTANESQKYHSSPHGEIPNSSNQQQPGMG